jgi:hydrophobic/amphiphilic exporter-1 (mainly G- bacteria), HAE1 family
MNIGKFSVTRPVAVTMRIAALVLLGYICLMRLPIDLLPRIDIPTLSVNVSWPNTPPATMETQITRPLEQAVSTVQGLKLVSSTSSLGNSNVRLQLNYGTNLDQASLDVIQQVQRVYRRFPNDPNISPPSVFKFDPNSLPILSYAVSGESDLVKMRDTLVNEISPMLESAGGVAQVNVGGGYDRAIMIDVDPVKLRAFGISIPDIATRLRQENTSQPAGFVREGNTQFSLRAIGYFKTVEEIRKLPLGKFNNQLVALGQVATVRDATQDINSYTRMRGEPAISISVTKQSDANTVDTAKHIAERLKDVKRSYPKYEFRPIYNQAQFVEHSITDLQMTAMIGGALAILIITFFLRNLRSTFVVALSIPISIISTFALIYFCGFTLNTISLSGLALASGLIVDDAIVVLENIFRHIERDKKRAADAAVSGTQEILSAVVASTFTVMIVFLPLLLIKGQTGQTFTQFALVVVFSLAISLLDAMTVVPMLASRMIREKDVIEEAHPELRTKTNPVTRLFDRIGTGFHNFDNSYRRGLTWAIHHRIAIVGIAVLAVVAAGALWPYVGRETLPKTDSGNINVNARLPIGTSIETTDRVMKKIEAILDRDPDIETYIVGAGTNVGLRGGGGGGGPNSGGGTIQLKEKRKSTTDEVVKRLQKQFMGIAGPRITVQPFDIVANIIGGNNFGVSVDIYGPTPEILVSASETVRDALIAVPGLDGVDTSVQDVTPEYQIEVDRDKAQTLGVSFSDIASTIAASTNGSLSTYFQDPKKGGLQVPIYLQVPLDMRMSIDQVNKLPIQGTEDRGTPVLIEQVAKVTKGAGPNQIQRQNRQRYVNVGGRVVDRPQNEVMVDMGKALQNVKLPQGAYWTFSARNLQDQEEYAGLGLAVFLAIALVYMLLATQFESFIYPLIVLCSVPLCAIGLVLALFLTGRSFGLTAFIGLLMLIGIVVKNGILLVDYTNQLRSRGMPRDEAILTAAPTRLRPILMTTLAAMLGMLPLALGIGSGSEMYVPLATAVIGGLATSTMLTLFIVPTVYTLFDDLARRIRKDDRDLDRPMLVEPSVAAAGGQEPAEVLE